MLSCVIYDSVMIIEIKHTLNVMCLNHPPDHPSPPPHSVLVGNSVQGWLFLTKGSRQASRRGTHSGGSFAHGEGLQKSGEIIYGQRLMGLDFGGATGSPEVSGVRLVCDPRCPIALYFSQ